MHRLTHRSCVALVVVAALVSPRFAVWAQQPDVTLTPFVSFLPTTGASPLAGLAMTLAGNGGLAVRASGRLSLEDPNTDDVRNSTTRPWGADLDAVLFLRGQAPSGLRRALAPFIFVGVGVGGGDSFGVQAMRDNWSYGGGLTVPLGESVDLFGESRWRAPQFVLPTARSAASPTAELRLGVSFRVGSGSPRGRTGSPDYAHASGVVMFPTLARYATSAAPVSTETRVLGTAGEYVGVPYRVGGTSPATGFDAAGFTQYVFAKQGVRLPRTASEQAQVGTVVVTDWSAVRPGDLVMFEVNGRIAHVAIYAGHNRIIHSTASGGGVRYDDLGTERGEWFVDHMTALRRVTPDVSGLFLDLAKGETGEPEQLDGPDHAPRPR